MKARNAPHHGERLHSGDFTHGGFRPHGDFQCWMEHGILMWENHGPFNLEALQAYGQMRRAAFERWQLDARPLGGIVHWTGSALMSPEAFEYYEKGFTAFIQSRHRYVAVAWAGDATVEGLDLMRLRFEPLFERHGLAFRLFDAVDAARRWVEPQLHQALQAPRP